MTSGVQLIGFRVPLAAYEALAGVAVGIKVGYGIPEAARKLILIMSRIKK